jgi:hypothetical protein
MSEYVNQMDQETTLFVPKRVRLADRGAMPESPFIFVDELARDSSFIPPRYFLNPTLVDAPRRRSLLDLSGWTANMTAARTTLTTDRVSCESATARPAAIGAAIGALWYRSLGGALGGAVAGLAVSLAMGCRRGGTVVAPSRTDEFEVPFVTDLGQSLVDYIRPAETADALNRASFRLLQASVVIAGISLAMEWAERKERGAKSNRRRRARRRSR